MIEKVTTSILGKGKSERSLREQIFEKVKKIIHTDTSDNLNPKELDNYIEKVARNAYKVVDKDIETLKKTGLTEDEILELTIVAAFGAGVSRVELATKLLD